MNTIIELNGTSVDLSNIKSAELCGTPLSSRKKHLVKLRFLKGGDCVIDPRTGHSIVKDAELSINYPDYFKAARGHSVLIRAWSRYKERSERLKLLREVEAELHL